MGVDLITRAARRVRNAAQFDVSAGRGVALGQRIGVYPSQDMQAEMSAMGAVPTLFSVVDLLATTIAAVDWHLYERYDPGTPVEDRTEVTRHPALEVWNRPNPFYSQRLFVETIIQHYELTGEWAWLIARFNGPGSQPLNLWPVRPDRLRPVPDPVRFISGFLYRTTVDIPLAVADVVWTKRPNPLDPYRGLSPVGTLLYDLRGEAAAAQWNAQFFSNSARPDGIIQVPDTLTQDEFDSLVAHWRESHQGTANAHRVAVLERGEYKNAGYSQKDMDFVALRGFTKEQIQEAYRISPVMLGKVQDVQRATANAQQAIFAQRVQIPRLDLLREALNTQLLPQFGTFGRDVQFDYADPVPEDSEEERAELAAKIAAVQAMVALGADPAEACDTFGLPAMSFDMMAAPVASPPTPAMDPMDPGNPDQGSELA